jgi:creatinine amidohydrolase
MSGTRYLAELRAAEIPSRLTSSSVLVQPVGAVEQHGPHLPLSTDLLIADAVTRAVLDAYGDASDLWLLPPLAYSKSNEHAWSAGTVWLSATTMLATLNDIGRSFAALPAGKLVFFNGHGGNSALLQVACRDLRLAHGLATFLMHPGLPPDHGGPSPASELGMGVHAGLDETSMVLHLRPDLVDLSAAARAVPEHLDEYRRVRFGGEVGFGWLSDDFGTAGVIGDPSKATAERGKELFDEVVAAAGESLSEVARFSHRP